MGDNKTTLTPEEEKRVQEYIEKQKQAERDAIIEAEARNRFLTEQRKQPGYRYN